MNGTFPSQMVAKFSILSKKLKQTTLNTGTLITARRQHCRPAICLLSLF